MATATPAMLFPQAHRGGKRRGKRLEMADLTFVFGPIELAADDVDAVTKQPDVDESVHESEDDPAHYEHQQNEWNLHGFLGNCSRLGVLFLDVEARRYAEEKHRRQGLVDQRVRTSSIRSWIVFSSSGVSSPVFPAASAAAGLRAAACVEAESCSPAAGWAEAAQRLRFPRQTAGPATAGRAQAGTLKQRQGKQHPGENANPGKSGWSSLASHRSGLPASS